MKRITSFSRYV